MRSVCGSEFVRGFAVTLKRRDFLKLSIGTFLLFNGIMVVNSFGAYITIFYVCGGNNDQGASYIGLYGTVSTICTLASIFFVTWLSTKLGKRRTFMVTTGVAVGASLIKWFCYDPDIPLLLLLPAPFIAFGLGGLFTLMGSMIADVCDLDELQSHERREGMFGSIYWWVVKLGMALALAAGGFLLNATGFDVALEGNQAASTIFLMRVFDAVVPMITSAIAIWAVYSYTLTEERAFEVRDELEQRRGAVAAA